MYKAKFSEQLMLAIYVALHFWICYVYAQGDGGGCTTVDHEISLFGIAIKPGVLLGSPIEIEMRNTKGVISHTEHPLNLNSKQYLSFEYDPDSEMVLIKTTDEFLKYEKDQTETQLTTFISLECDNDKNTEMGIIFSFEKVNNFAPEFNQPSYEIEIPLPLPSGLDISLLLSQSISATDYDLYNNQIRFTSDLTAPFSVGTSSVTAEMGKTYFATLLTTDKVLKIQNGMEFKIRATDSGTETPRYTEANVKFIVPDDFKELVEVPIFVKSLYKGILDFHKTTPLEIETISLLNDTFIPSIAFEIELGDDTYFEVSELENAIKIKLKDTVTENDLNGETQFTFVIRATRPDGISGNTAAIINTIYKQQDESLLFENTLYTGTIKSDMTIDHVPIKLTDATYQSDVEFLIAEDYWGIFDVIFEPNVNEMRIVLLRPVSDYELLDTSLVSLTLLARRAGNIEISGKSVIVLGIERPEGSTNAFEKSIYSGYFKRSSSNDSFQLEPLLLLRTPVNVGFKLSGEDTHLIKIHQSLENGVILGLVETITIDDTGGRTVLSVIVSAILTDTVIVSTVALIHVDQIPESCELTILVSIIILVAILLISGSAIFVMWWKWIRPYRYVKRDSWNEQLENDFNAAGFTEPVVDDIVTKSDADLIGNSNFEIKNENGPSSPVALANSLQSVLKNYDNHKVNLVLESDTESVNSEKDDSQPTPKVEKKSIKFNETVERIDIVDNFIDKESTSL